MQFGDARIQGGDDLGHVLLVPVDALVAGHVRLGVLPDLGDNFVILGVENTHFDRRRADVDSEHVASAGHRVHCIIKFYQVQNSRLV